jgi:hypothetical protein
MPTAAKGLPHRSKLLLGLAPEFDSISVRIPGRVPFLISTVPNFLLGNAAAVVDGGVSGWHYRCLRAAAVFGRDRSGVGGWYHGCLRAVAVFGRDRTL